MVDQTQSNKKTLKNIKSAINLRFFNANLNNNLIMKFKIIGVIFLFIVVVFVGLSLPTESVSYDYLRLHIRANSNLKIDQDVKYKVKDFMVDYLTPLLCNVSSKPQAVDIINDRKDEIEYQCLNLLRDNGFYYGVNIKINNEYFPTRNYNNTTLDAGYYDAVIVELGNASGDNWWCVMYPPLCFVNKNQQSMHIKYKSRFVEWFHNLFK